MAARVFIRTLNGIRTAQQPSGRDVAEAFDDVLAAVAKLQTGAAAAPAAAPVPPTTSPTKAQAKQVTNIGQPTGQGAGISPFAGFTQVVIVTSSYTMVGNEYMIEVEATSPTTINISGSIGKTVTVKNLSANGIVLTIVDAGGGTIDQQASVEMEWYRTSATFINDGQGNWAVT